MFTLEQAKQLIQMQTPHSLEAVRVLNMQILRELKKVSDRQIIINLPESFYAKEVEIIVIPYKNGGRVDDKNLWKKDFLSISKWDITEEDIKIPYARYNF